MNSFIEAFNIKRVDDHKDNYFNEINLIKSFSIIAVIILHTIPSNILFTIFAPFHIWHAVPIFIMIAGMNSTLSAFKQGEFNFLNEYSVYKLKKYFQRILIPFSIVWLVEIYVLILRNEATTGKIILTFFTGGIGPGSYFTPLFIQHLIVFPGILWIKNKFISYDQYVILVCFFLISLFLEFLCVIFNIPEWLYRLLYVRYIFASIIGSYIVSHKFKKSTVMLLASLSFVYIVCVSYLKFDLLFIYPAWDFQHAPAYFYTAFFLFFLWWIYPFFRQFDIILIPFGKATYHIFLFQMLWFWIFTRILRAFISNDLVSIALNIFVCLLFGYVFFKIQLFALSAIRSVFAFGIGRNLTAPPSRTTLHTDP